MNDLKGVLRITTTMFLFVGFFRLLAYTGETQEQQIERLIKQSQKSENQNCGDGGPNPSNFSLLLYPDLAILSS